MATKVVKLLFAIAGLFFLVTGILPALRGQEVNAGALSTAAVFLVLSIALRQRRRPIAPPGPGA